MNLLTVLLQVNTDSVNAIAQVPAEVPQLSLLYLLKEGGLLMIPLLICSIIMIYIFFERYFAIKKLSDFDNQTMAQVRSQLHTGNVGAAKLLLNSSEGVIQKMLVKGISRIGRPVDQIEKGMENVGKVGVYQMEKNVSILNTIASIAPMFGFLGTIAGMIILFYNIQTQGFELESIAGGIYTKMVTSAVGLIIGLVSYVGYKFLNAQINKTVNKMEIAANEFVDILLEPAQKTN